MSESVGRVPAVGGGHSGVIDQGQPLFSRASERSVRCPSERRAEYSKAIRWGYGVLLKGEPTRQEGHCHQFVFLFDADLRADAVPPQSAVEGQTDLTAEQKSKGSSGHLHAIGRLLDQTSADAFSSQRGVNHDTAKTNSRDANAIRLDVDQEVSGVGDESSGLREAHVMDFWRP
jgi:hypothetical protein